MFYGKFWKFDTDLASFHFVSIVFTNWTVWGELVGFELENKENPFYVYSILSQVDSSSSVNIDNPLNVL